MEMDSDADQILGTLSNQPEFPILKILSFSNNKIRLSIQPWWLGGRVVD